MDAPSTGVKGWAPSEREEADVSVAAISSVPFPLTWLRIQASTKF